MDYSMTRKYLNDRWCVRCGRTGPTPYLKKVVKLLPKSGRVLDIGCGNGRNSHYMKSLGYDVVSVDMANDFGERIILGHDPLPDGPFDVILSNYVLMFLSKIERSQVNREVEKVAGVGCIMVVEMYPAKDAHEYDFEAMFGVWLAKGWVKLRKSKERCVLMKPGDRG